ncbi:MAG: TolC family protein [candidate division Zixibacteria bacterium]
MKIVGVLMALIICAPIINAETITLSREKAVKLALERNEQYKSALLERERIQGQYVEARSGAFPRITFDGSYLRNIDLQSSVLTMENKDTGKLETFNLKFGTPHNYSFGFSLYQPLYAAGKVGTAIKIAKYGFAYTDESIRVAGHDVATEADKAYLDAVAANEAAQVFRDAELVAQANLEVVEKLYNEGQTSEYELLRAQVQAANTQPDRIRAENDADLAMNYLKNILALEPETRIELGSTIEEISIPELKMDDLISEAIANRPEISQSREMMNINKKLISIAKSGYKPDIGINSRLQWDSFKDAIGKTSIAGDSWYRSWNVEVVLSWPIFSGFETGGKVQQAKVDYNQSRLTNSQLTRQIQLEVRDAVGKVNEARQRVEALGETVEQAERGLSIGEVRFENGIGTQLELLDSQVALTMARVNRVAALHDLAVAVSALRRAVGRDWGTQW